MRYSIVIPADGEARPAVPKGAALLSVRGNRALVYHAANVSFAEACARALRAHQLVNLDFDTRQIGFYDDHDGEAQLLPQGAQAARQWCGRVLYRNDLMADDNRQTRRQQARRLTFQGRYAEAARLDRRLGL